MEIDLWALLMCLLQLWLRLVASLERVRQLLDAHEQSGSAAATDGTTMTDVTWSPDGTHLACTLSDGRVKVWDIGTGTPVFTYLGHADWATAVAWSPDGTRLASAGYDGTVQLWGAETGEAIFTYSGHSGEVRAVAWSPDSTRLASAGYDGTVQLWSAETGETLRTCLGHSNVVTTVAWSPDGAYLLSGSRDHTVRLWDQATGNELALVWEHRAKVNDVAWSPQFGVFASASNDATVKVWQMEPEQFSCTCLSTYERHASTGGVVAVAWSPDGKRIISVDRSTIHEWTVFPPHAAVVLPIPAPSPQQRSEVFALDSRAHRRHPAYPEGTRVALAGDGWIFLGDSPASSLTEEWSAN